VMLPRLRTEQRDSLNSLSIIESKSMRNTGKCRTEMGMNTVSLNLCCLFELCLVSFDLNKGANVRFVTRTAFA
jgi:hypothetical protein